MRALSRACTTGTALAALLLATLASGQPATDGSAANDRSNAGNLGRADATRRYDGEGLAQFKTAASRTPSGLLYEWPTLPRLFRTADGGWSYRGALEYGFLLQDDEEKAAEFTRYQDFSDGAFIHYLSMSFWNADQGRYLELEAGGVGRDDAWYAAELRQYGKYALSAFYSQSPLAYSRNDVTIFNGAGSENLTLPAGLTPGNNSLAAIALALDQAYHPDLSISRRESGLALEYAPREDTTLFASWELQRRNGSRPFGGAFFPPFYTGGTSGGMVETIEPVDQAANELSAGLSLVRSEWQWNLAYHVSLFDNDKGVLTFENPFTNLSGTDFLVERGRFDLAPDNEFHRLSSELTLALPFRGQFFSLLSWSRARQDDELLPFTVNSGLSFTGIDLDQWNRIDSLPVRSADARIDTLHARAGVQLSPWNAVSLRAELGYQDEDNDTEYTDRNALSGEFGYITVDGGYLGSVFQPFTPQQPIHFRSIPFAVDRLQAKLEGDYRFSSRNVLSLKYRYEQRRFAHRERDELDENRVELYLANRSLSWMTARLSYAHARREGDSYDFNPYAAFYTASLPDFLPVLPQGPNAHTLADLRKFDLADRRRHEVAAKLNFLLRDSMDLSLSADWTRDDYDARYGLQEDNDASLNLEWNYQPTPTLSAYAFTGIEDGSSEMANINDSGFSTDARAGGETYPLDAAWREASDERSTYFGVGLRYLFGAFDLDTSYSFNRSRSRLDYLAASSAALASREFPELQGVFPDIEFDRHILESSLRWHARSDIAFRLYHRYEKSDTRDWHYQDLQPLIGNHLFLDASPQRYGVHVVGLSAQYRLE